MTNRSFGLGPSISFVLGIAIEEWGSTVTVSCLYEPSGVEQPYKAVFRGCSDLRWTVHTPQEIGEQMADIYEFRPAGGNIDFALLFTDIFELCIWYRDYVVVKDW